jgi:hypothetical protein
MDEKDLGVFLREQKKDLSSRKSIKVKLPIKQHIKLHALKLFTENNISETVEIALDEFFERQQDEGEASVAGEVADEVAGAEGTG